MELLIKSGLSAQAIFYEVKQMIMRMKLITAMLALMSLAVQAQLSQTGPVSLDTGNFPVYYQDADGLTLDLCLPTPGDERDRGLCLLTGDDFPNRTGGTSFPDNFPEEAFWWNGGSSLDLPNGKQALLVMALEAAFANGGPVPGEQVAFARIRVRINSPDPGHYVVIHPYGTEVFDVAAGQAKFTLTNDIGVTCGTNFTCAANGAIGPFLRPSQDPVLGGGNPKPPIEHVINGRVNRYIADPAIETTVTGGVNDFFKIVITSPNGIITSSETRFFTLMGRIQDGTRVNSVNRQSALGGRVADPFPSVITKGKASIGLKTVAKGMVSPVTATYAPKDKNHLFVAEQNGKIWSVQTGDDGGQATKNGARRLFADLGSFGLNLGCFGINYDERGLFGLAFHPNYRNNGMVYTFQSQPHQGATKLAANLCNSSLPDHDNVITEWKVKNPGRNNAKLDLASGREVLRVAHPQFNHNGGELRFGPDGMLYISIGDGGSADDQGSGHSLPDGNAQDLSNLQGKILRIDPLPGSAPLVYKIPGDNPFVNTPGSRGEIWALGFRNPYKMSFDWKTGQLYVADVGQNNVEEINIIRGGMNYGWPIKEGTFAFDQNGAADGFLTRNPVLGSFVDPIAAYDHCIPPANPIGACQKKEGTAIVGGFVYRGNAIKELRGRYVFGDYSTDFSASNGRLFYLDNKNQVKEFRLAAKPRLGISVLGIGQDTRGELYVLGKSGATPSNTGITDANNRSGVVRKLVPNKL